MKKSLSKRFFFKENDEDCYNLPAMEQYMIDNSITEMTVWLAKREVGASYFFCKLFEEVGTKGDGDCGKNCEQYKPRNGKSGICGHYGYVYERTNETVVLRVND